MDHRVWTARPASGNVAECVTVQGVGGRLASDPRAHARPRQPQHRSRP